MRAPGDVRASIVAALLMLGSVPAAAEVRFEAAAGVTALRGDATYAIGVAFSTPEGGGLLNDPVSELAFPLDATLATLAASAEAPLTRGTLVVSGEFSRTVTDASGTLVDRDWTSLEQPGLVTIFSEADVALEASIVDLRARWRFLELDGPAFGVTREGRGAWAAVGAGYLWEHFTFAGSNVRQRSADPALTGTRAGPVLDYEALYRIPYAELAAGVGFGSPSGAAVALEARLGASPWAQADDVDDHLLRAKRAEGSCTGTALLAGVRARLDAGRFFLLGSLTRVAIDTEGTQVQERYADTTEGPAGPIGTIEQTITSAQTRWDLAAGIRF